MTRSKRCFTPICCELQSKCSIAHQPYTNGYFQPTVVGEHCHHFQPLPVEIDLHERIKEMMA